MRVQRTLTINPIEPQLLNMRVPSGMPLTVDFQYVDVAGNVLKEDLVAQLQLTSRSYRRVDTYAAPASDIVNGKARVGIEEGALTDPNGYRIHLVGTYKGEAALFALGTMKITDPVGFEAVPIDIIDNVPLTIGYNFDAAITIRLWKDAAKTTPYDATTTAISATIYSESSLANPLAFFTVTPTALPGEVILGLPMDVVNTLPPACWWALRASSAGGITTLAQGSVTITGIRP